ncbi:MAG: cation:proton antiporter [Gammaproteobacteria bacterium]|nr:cation:proton antiporter [Gammaproteobacteria bacterium]
MIALLLSFAFIAGLLFLKIGYPPMLGYLLAGFICFSLGAGDSSMFDYVAQLGVTMLLFTIGLKLRPVQLTKHYIFLPALLHMLLVIPLTAAAILLAGNFYAPLALNTASAVWILAFALSFSSTVFAIKIFSERGEEASFYASAAIGVLVLQDIAAVVYLVFTTDYQPSYWSIALLLIIPLWKQIKGLINYLLAEVGHGELQILFGFFIAMGAYELFEVLHLKGGLGALVAGALLSISNQQSASELYKRLADLKDLFLVGFFMQIGYYGLPSISMFVVAIGLVLVLFLRPIIYYRLFTVFRLRARTAWLSGIGLFTYSEFGLIVMAIALSNGLIHKEWLVTHSLAIALSFFIATFFNRSANDIYARYSSLFEKLQKDDLLANEKIEPLGDADIVILGMGRVGISAYDYLSQRYPGRIVGVEERYERTVRLKNEGYRVVHGDATDRDFWSQTQILTRKTLFISLTNHNENMSVVKLARMEGYQNTVAVTAKFEDEKTELEELGCVVYNLYTEIGKSFAEHIEEQTDL